MCAEHQAAVVGHVQPFEGVGGPRVGELDPGQQVAQGWAGRGPEPEGSIDVHPRVGFAGEGADLGERIGGAGVDVAGLGAHDGRSGVAG